jgi:CRISPR-associated endonuclease Cas2
MFGFIIAYDILDKKRLAKIRKIVQQFSLGGQKSCYEAKLDKSSLNALIRLIEENIQENDKVNIINIQEDAILLGKAYQTKFENGGIIIL